MLDKLCFTVVLMRDAPKSPAEAIRQRQGADIRKFRKFTRVGDDKREMSQSDLANVIGVTKAAVSDWERGNSSPRPHLQVEIAKALNVPWSSIFGLDREAAAS